MSKHKPRLWPPVPRPELAPAEGGTFGRAALVDNHTHLPLLPGEFISDTSGVRLSAEEQVRRARMTGVEAMVVSQCSLVEVQTLDEQRERFALPIFDSVFFAVAIHPNEAPHHEGILETGPDNVAQIREAWQEVPLADALTAVEQAARRIDKVVAIGETGLDYFRTAEVGKDAQKQSFAAHIELAKSLDLPLQIHDREAHADCVELLLRVGAPRRTVFHCFSGDRELAEILSANGWYASFAGNVTYPANRDLQEAVLVMPRELCLVETDAPYLTPQPYRGRPNASYLVGHTADFLAQLAGVDSDTLRCQICENAGEVYGIGLKNSEK